MISGLKGNIQNDVLKEFMVQNTYIYPPRQLLCKVTADETRYALLNMTLFNSVSVPGYHMQEAGSNESSQLEFTIVDRL